MEEMAYTVDNLIPINTLFSRSFPSRHVMEIAQFPFPFHDMLGGRAIAPGGAFARGFWFAILGTATRDSYGEAT